MNRLLIKHISQIATPCGYALLKGEEMNHIHCISDGAIYMEGDTIRYVGTTKDILKKVDEKECEVMLAEGKCAIPGFVDSHTHFLFGGYRQDEFVERVNKTPYEVIMKRGGGIQSTVKATRNTSLEELIKEGSKRIKKMMEQGVTTLEGKSGYGLDDITERRQLEAMKRLNEEEAVSIVPTYLGAHSIPHDYEGKAEEYVDFMLNKVLPIISEQGLAKFCDVFCEEGVFSVEQSEALLWGAKQLGLKVKIHADELTGLGGAELAARLGAQSADHLLMASENGILELAASNTVATLLPATAFCLNKPYANARKMIDRGCAVALASDFNPGSCFSSSIPLLFALAVLKMNMTIEEALCALTLNGAAALDLAGIIGSIQEGKKADIVLLEYPDYRFLAYHTASQLVDTVIKNGTMIYQKK